MKFKFAQTVILAVLLILLDIRAAQDEHKEYKYSVKGRVMDERGRSVPRARVILQPAVQSKTSEETIVHEMFIHHETDANGRFRIDEKSSLRTEEWILYVITSLPSHTYAPITPPFRELNDTEGRFAGRSIFIKEDQDVDLGDVPVQVRYGLVFLHLLDHSGRSLFGDLAKEIDLRRLWLRVRDAQGDVASEGGIGRDAFRKSESAIALALPEGRWQLELAENSNTMKWHRLDKELFIQPATRPLNVILKLPEGGWSSAATRAGKIYDARFARDELERRGIAYNEETFVQRARNGNIDIVELFLAARMDPNARERSGRTGLMTAAERGFGEIVQALLHKHADVNATDNEGATALMFAAGGFDSDIVKLLVDKGAELNAKSNNGLTALIFAVANDRLANVRLLLAAGADVSVRDKDGKTALRWAVESGYSNIVELLNKHPARN